MARLHGQPLLRLLVAALVTVAAASGCSGDESTSDGDPTTTTAAGGTSDGRSNSDGENSGAGALACAVLSAADLASAGLDGAQGPTETPLSPSDECHFDLPGDDRVSVVIYTELEGVALTPELYDDAEVVDGIGVVAWWVPSLGLAQARLEDDRVVTVQHVTTTADKDGVVTLLDRAVQQTLASS